MFFRIQRKKVARSMVPSGGGNGLPFSLAEVYFHVRPKPNANVVHYYIGFYSICQYRFHKKKVVYNK
jgi:hypothetical protein